MRPGQNKRIRGRNRRGPNPLTRSFESNGPDVKVRGTAQHVAEKYTQLARDAHVSGDPVMAESYLQHAEHYYRLIAAAHQAQTAVQNGTADERDDDEDDFDTASDRFTFRTVQPQTAQGQNQPYSGERGANEGGEGGDEGDDQPQERQSQDRQPQERHSQDRQDRHQGRGDRPHTNDRNPGRGRDRNQDRNFRPGGERAPGGERSHGGDRPSGGERPQAYERNQERGGFNPNRPRRPQPDLEGAEQPVLPAFLTAPVRIVPIEVPEPAGVPVGGGDDVGSAPLRARRRRRTRVDEVGSVLETETSGSDPT